MTRFRPFVVVFLCLLPMQVAVGAGSKDKAPPVFDFAPAPAPGTPQLSGTMWIHEGADYTIRLQRVRQADRLNYIKRVAGSSTDPFATPPELWPRYLTFLIEIENSGEGEYVFQPKNCWLLTDKSELLVPIGLEDLQATYNMFGEELGPAYRNAAPAVMHTTHILPPGQSTSGLLVYNAFKKTKTKAFRVDLVLTSSTGDVMKISAPYVRPKKGKKG